MLLKRIIPCLLIKDGGLVKTKNFKEAKYVGDPINAVKIFSEKEADEILIVEGFMDVISLHKYGIKN